MANRYVTITEVEKVDSLDTTDNVFVNNNGTLKQAAINDILASTTIGTQVTALEGEVDNLQSDVGELNSNVSALNITVDTLKTLSYTYATVGTTAVNTEQPVTSLVCRYGNLVIFRGYISTAYMVSGKPFFNIPEGYRPKKDEWGLIEVIRHTHIGTAPPFGYSIKIKSDGDVLQEFNNEGTGTPWQVTIFACWETS